MHCKKTSFSLKSQKREEFIPISADLNNILKKLNVGSGILKIFIPHTTASVTINQNANPDVMTDLITIINDLIPQKPLLNIERNSDAHFKSSLFGSTLEIPFEKNELELGKWQEVFFCEFDGPRTRNIKVHVWYNID